MSRNPRGGHEAYSEGPTRPRPPGIVHLRVGADTAFPGPACGTDTLAHNRGNRSRKLNLTDDLSQVTCGHCRRSLTFKRRARESE